jgi:hypothetical protein
MRIRNYFTLASQGDGRHLGMEQLKLQAFGHSSLMVLELENGQT